MNRTGTVLLEFDPDLNELAKDKKLWDGLSAVVQVGDTLWVANDEALSLERLSRQPGIAGGEIRHAGHRQFPLHEVLQLPMPPAADGKIEEADVEGLDYQDGYLWLVGSHSLKRGNPDEKDPVQKNIKRLSKVRGDGNRFLLARIPLAETAQSLERKVEQDGHSRTAARLRGDADGNALTEALAADEHLGPFLAIPGKDNGFDIEGLAVAGDRVFVGLRGPVLRGWAVLLELAVEERDPSTLALKPIGPDGRPYRKHFLDLRGLGVRDLCVRGSDLLILAGPTMALAGRMTLFRWPGGARPDRGSLVFSETLPTVLELPSGAGQNAGKDQAEGLTLFAPDGGEASQVLVVYDSTAPSRQRGTSTVEADLFALP
jgi:hypothetical protein